MFRSRIPQFFINRIKFYKQKQPSQIQQKQRKSNFGIKNNFKKLQKHNRIDVYELKSKN